MLRMDTSSSEESQSVPSGSGLKREHGGDGYKSSKPQRTASRGVSFQKKLLMLFMKTAIDKKYEFALGTELNAAGKFDDIYIRYESGDRSSDRFLQAKHRDDPTKGITPHMLIHDKHFGIVEHYKSFREIVVHKLFEYKSIEDLKHNVKDFTIITTWDFKFNQEERKVIEEEEIKEEYFSNKDLKSDDPDNEFLYVGGEAVVRMVEKPYMVNVKNIIKSAIGSEQNNKATTSEQDKNENNFLHQHSDDDIIEIFLSKFKYITKYPKEDELDKLIKTKLGEKFELYNADFVSSSIDTEVTNYLKSYNKGEVNFYTHEDGAELYKSLTCKINTLLVSGVSHYKWYKITSNGIDFEPDDTLESKINTFLERENERIFRITSKCTRLSAIKLLNISKSRIVDDCIYINAKALDEHKEMYESVFCTEESPPLLIIKCPNPKDKYLKYLVTVHNFCTDVIKKKVIVIINSEHKSSDFQLTCIDYDDEKLSYKDLTLDSQKEMLKQEIKFQGKTIKLNRILDVDAAKKVFDSPPMLRKLFRKLNLIIEYREPFKDSSACMQDRHTLSKWKEHATLSESELIELEQKIVIIATEAGFEKSTILTSLAMKLRDITECPPWIVWIDLIERKHLNFMRMQNCNITDAFAKEYLLNTAVPDRENELERKLFEAVINRRNNDKDKYPKIVIFFDGFDEIGNQYKPNVTNLMKIFKKNENTQIWVKTCNSEQKNDLENELASPAY